MTSGDGQPAPEGPVRVAAAARTAHADGSLVAGYRLSFLIATGLAVLGAALVAGYRLSFLIATGLAVLGAALVAIQSRSGDSQAGDPVPSASFAVKFEGSHGTQASAVTRAVPS